MELTFIELMLAASAVRETTEKLLSVEANVATLPTGANSDLSGAEFVSRGTKDI
jgi:hypothetical protein